jgi:hypothetical protein
MAEATALLIATSDPLEADRSVANSGFSTPGMVGEFEGATGE